MLDVPLCHFWVVVICRCKTLQIETFEQRLELCVGQGYLPLVQLQPDETCALDAFVDQKETSTVSHQHLNFVAPLRAKYEENPEKVVEIRIA